VQIIISLVVTSHWPLYQLDVKNAFLNGVLDKGLHEQPLEFVTLGESGKCIG